MDLSRVPRLHESLTAGYLEQYRLLPVARHNGSVVIAHAGAPDLQALADRIPAARGIH